MNEYLYLSIKYVTVLQNLRNGLVAIHVFFVYGVVPISYTVEMFVHSMGWATQTLIISTCTVVEIFQLCKAILNQVA